MNMELSAKEKKRARAKAYYAANREKVLARGKAYRAANREKIAAHKKAYRAANREKVAASEKAYASTERGRLVRNRANQDHYYRNREEILERQKTNRRIKRYDLKPENFTNAPSYERIKIINTDIDVSDILSSGDGPHRLA